MNNIKGLTFALLAMASLIYSCEVDPPQPLDAIDDTGPITFVKPPHFPNVVYNLDSNPVTTEGFVLGRKLFYDPILSKDNSISCGECHQQFAAFAHADHKFSHGINGQNGTRNSPPLFNLAFHTDLMWDGGVTNLELQPVLPITNPVEMDETLPNVIAKLNNSSTYRQLFRNAYGDENINAQRMLRALTDFLVMMVSANAKYDKVKLGKDVFTSAEQQGYNVFLAKCNACHTEPLFTDRMFRNNGLDRYPTDAGRAMITFNPADSGKMKVPSLRNLKYTYPYMHDGRFLTLDAVLQHYQSGIQPCATLDTLLYNGIVLTSTEKNNLLLFLATLNDETLLNDKKLAEHQ